MPLAMPQPDFEPSLRLHLSAFQARVEVDEGPLADPDEENEDDDPVGNTRRASHMLMVHADAHPGGGILSNAGNSGSMWSHAKARIR